jgi:hypothetical protein
MGSLTRKKPAVFVPDCRQFMNNDLLDGLYWEDTMDDGSQPNFLCPFGNETAGQILAQGLLTRAVIFVLLRVAR